MISIRPLNILMSVLERMAPLIYIRAVIGMTAYYSPRVLNRPCFCLKDTIRDADNIRGFMPLCEGRPLMEGYMIKSQGDMTLLFRTLVMDYTNIGLISIFTIRIFQEILLSSI